MKNVLLKVPLVIYSPKGFLCYIQHQATTIPHRKRISISDDQDLGSGLNLVLETWTAIWWYNQPTDKICRQLFYYNICLPTSTLLCTVYLHHIVVTTQSRRQSLITTQLNMIESVPVHPAATFSTRGRLRRNAVAVVLTFAFICAVFLSTHQMLASAPTSSRTDEHHKVKVWFLNSSHFEGYKLEYASISCFKQLRNILIICTWRSWSLLFRRAIYRGST